MTMKQRLLATMALAAALSEGSGIESNLLNDKKNYNPKDPNNPHGFPQFTFNHQGREYIIYAYNEMAAQEKFNKIIKNKK